MDFVKEGQTESVFCSVHDQIVARKTYFLKKYTLSPNLICFLTLFEFASD